MTSPRQSGWWRHWRRGGFVPTRSGRLGDKPLSTSNLLLKARRGRPLGTALVVKKNLGFSLIQGLNLPRSITYSSTISAVTMPNIPSSLSAWLRMWQWKAQTPGSVASTSASKRWPGAMLRVSHLYGWGSSHPS